MKHDWRSVEIGPDYNEETRSITKTKNNINDWILNADFDWKPNDNNRVRFGAGYTLHSFLPAKTSRNYTVGSVHAESRDSTWKYLANEVNLYIEDDCEQMPGCTCQCSISTTRQILV